MKTYYCVSVTHDKNGAPFVYDRYEKLAGQPPENWKWEPSDMSKYWFDSEDKADEFARAVSFGGEIPQGY